MAPVALENCKSNYAPGLQLSAASTVRVIACSPVEAERGRVPLRPFSINATLGHYRGASDGSRVLGCDTILAVGAFRQLGALILLLVTCLAPAMACMVPGAEMSAQERSCCRAMKNQCGQMGMPASHGCCQKDPQSVHDNALTTKAVALSPVAITAIWLTAFNALPLPSVVVGCVEHPNYSPPESPPPAVSILRI